jgi:CheY-like chemotaxis protein
MGFARQEALRPEAIDVADQVLGMSELMARALREDIKVEVDFENSLWPVFADPTQFEVALLNLAVNGRDAMPEGGTLRIVGRKWPNGQDPDLTGDWVRLTVEDTGTGMPTEVIERAFEPFFTTKGVGKGSGLGLSQVYGFANRAGGTVRIESVVGAGTKVHVLLPRSDQTPTVRALHSRAASDIQGIRVLVVEDEPVVATMVAAALEDLGCRVQTATNAGEALDILKQEAAIDLLFSDIVMPGSLNGVALAHEARSLRPDLGVVLTTGYTEDAGRTRGLRILRKPYRIDALASAIAAEIARQPSEAEQTGAASVQLTAPAPAVLRT